MKTSFFVLLITSFLLLVSCKDKDRSADIVAQLNPTDTFLIDLPKRKGKNDSLLRRQKSYSEKALGLQSLEKGFDSIQIRVWYGGERLVVLSIKDDKWVAEISKITYEDNSNFKHLSNTDYFEQYLPKRISEYKVPKSGWKIFIKKLFEQNILTLPDEEGIKNFRKHDAYDGNGIVVEIATKNVYREYSYGEMDSYNEMQPEVKNISSILKLIDKEFSLKQLWDYTNEIILPHVPDSIRKVKIQEIQLQEVKPEKKNKKK